jgi:hypothetical protein
LLTMFKCLGFVSPLIYCAFCQLHVEEFEGFITQLLSVSVIMCRRIKAWLFDDEIWKHYRNKGSFIADSWHLGICTEIPIGW